MAYSLTDGVNVAKHPSVKRLNKTTFVKLYNKVIQKAKEWEGVAGHNYWWDVNSGVPYITDLLNMPNDGVLDSHYLLESKTYRGKYSIKTANQIKELIVKFYLAFQYERIESSKEFFKEVREYSSYKNSYPGERKINFYNTSPCPFDRRGVVKPEHQTAEV